MTRRGRLGRRSAGISIVVAGALALSASAAFAIPQITIDAPQGGATYEVGQPVTIDYSCTSPFTVTQCDLSDGGGRLVPGTPLDTSTAGTFVVGVSLADSEPSDGVFNYLYSVVDATAPTVTLTTPADGARYSALLTLFRPIRVSYSCADAPAGIASCTGSQPDGTRLNTGFTALGRHSFVVTAVDNAGQTTTVRHTYTVTL